MNHSVQLGTRYIKPWWGLYSDLQLDPFVLGAGDSIKVYVEWNWADRGEGQDFNKDWSLVVWGEEGKATLTHDAGLETDHLPYIERQEGDIDEGNFSVEGHLTLYEEEVIAYEESITVRDIDTDGTEMLDENSAERFNLWAEDYTVTTERDCGAGIYENGGLYEDGFRYATVMLNTCKHRNKVYTVYMNYDDWLRVEHFYSRVGSDGTVRSDTILQKCKYYEENWDVVACSFELGYIENYEELGLAGPWQARAGF